jgi:hypothetical protein
MDSQPQEKAFNIDPCSACEGNDYLTLKQAQRNNLNPKQNFTFKRICGIL